MKKTTQVANQAPTKNTRPGGVIRIIGGDWRGRKLPVLDQDGLRPTSDRVRETLFNWLQFEIAGKRCLDVFAGSGALGFEAKSRGAREVLMLEKSEQVARQLTRNSQLLKAHAIKIQTADSLQYLAHNAEQGFDLVFIDPPFNQNLVQPTLDALFKNGWLNHQAWLYIEQEKQLDWPTLPSGWQIYREKATAQTRFALWHPVESSQF
ncbi:MAG: 16S rRNA (guanine(966)-N(2))-methyltransferase RsmD [Thiomicrospira sp.]|uniref:16S rRNA (guanine(966)-N(2))-methyltransferase RsmD n=1 Tax=Thiomicrospira sp. TaxID=935 RepID=UPI0019E9FB4C|nr:16S rRNA (guanine(966)-N(2))-methyltransferase RsmD [Thiomicrospira sp.]MBE0493188.1 16S rRNA (guanine(966)-N(2))-methyltransferase RsmD [Thiomicrospira sp.]